MKKRYTLASILVIGLAVFGWMCFGTATTFTEKLQYVYVYENEDIQTQVNNQLKAAGIRNTWLFNLAANQLGIWKKIKPGRFEIQQGESIASIVRTFRNNRQSAVKLVINKVRTKEDLAGLIGKNFISDSATAIAYLNNADSLKTFGVDSNTLFTIIIPNTYIFNWNTPLKKIFTRLKTEKEQFWEKNSRLEKASALNLSVAQVYTLASIVEEETNKNDEKGNIASVYLNRVNKNMYLGADPTIKFALKNFTLKRILFGHLSVNSPYNTYKNKGLPPGPICTPSVATLDAVLSQPKTDYIFFVAKADFSGYHHFSSNYAEHAQYAKEYQQALDVWMQKNEKK